MERQVFNRQPARAVIIDLQPPMDAGTCLNIKDALDNVLTMLTHLMGPCRVPLFSLSVLRSYTECLFPLQPVKGNFPRVHAALSELDSFARQLISHHRGHTRSSLLDGIQEALTQFNRLSLSLKQGTSSNTTSSTSPSQVDIIILTAQEPSLMQQYIERVADHLDLEHLKKISAVCISDPEKLVEQNLQVEQDPVSSITQSLSQMPTSPSELSLSILDLTTCDNDSLSLQSMLKSWLHDCGTDSEHLHLTLPSPSSGPATPIVLKCDLQERMIHPSLLPPSFTGNFLLSTGSIPALGQLTSSSGRGNSSNPSSNLPVYKLKAVGSVACSGVCESVIYGMPLLVRPTSCWKLEWEELEGNQQNFQALCHQLREKDQALIVCTDITSSESRGHFLLFPSLSPSSLLLKSVVVNELLLPVDLEGRGDFEQPSSDILDTMGESLNKLDSFETYNPLLMHSNLHVVLSNTSQRRVQLSRGSQRRGTGSDRGRGGGSGQGISSTAKRKSTGIVSKSVPPNVTRGGRSLGPKRPRIMRGGFVYGGDNISN